MVAGVKKTENLEIDALLEGWKREGEVITFSFDDETSKTYSPLTPLMQNHVRDIFYDILDPLLGVSFQEVSDENGKRGDIQLVLNSAEESPGSAISKKGLIRLRNNPQDILDLEKGIGTYAYSTIIHEILHTLGLKHPGNYNGKDGLEDPPYLPYKIDNTLNSIMSYNNTGANNSTPMPYDIRALQSLYGKDNQFSGDTKYVFQDIFSYQVEDVKPNGVKTNTLSPAPVVKQTIFDSAGKNVVDFSNLSKKFKGYHFDLKEGGLFTEKSELNAITYQPRDNSTDASKISSEKTTKFGTRIAFETNIYDAIGSTSNDDIFGNLLPNFLAGNQGRDILDGQAGNDTLDGGLGNDSMSGGEGDDSYYVDNSFDTITESNFQGNDIVYSSSINYTLSDNLENLNLLEASDAIDGTGNKLNNIITSNSRNNSLNGLGGNDTLIGAGGNDSYYVDIIGEKIIEFSGEGNDTVYSLITYTLGENLENLTLNGNAEIDGIGNNLDNIIIGNKSDNYLKGGNGNDIIDGGFGNDSMSGELGDDGYYLDSINDTITELINEGNDTVYSSITYTLGENLENLTLNGNAEIYGTGNNLENIIIGNNNNNYLEGLTGNDTLIGGNGNDTLDGGFDNDSMSGELGDDSYYVDSINDTITELTNEGNDTAYSSITYTLGENLENLTLIGNDAINGTGNSLNNIITGNSVNNSLKGKQGNDKLIGGKGADILDGGEGSNDTASYSTATDGVTANLTNSQENTGDAQGDVFQSIENLEGSEFGVKRSSPKVSPFW